MKTTISILVLLIISLSISAQTAIKKSNISTTGAVVSNGTTKVIYTVGEFAVQENTQGTVHISEGFINPDMLITTGLDKYNYEDFDVQIFPNPAVNYVNVKPTEISNFNIELFDVNGKLIMSENGKNALVKRLNISHLTNGEYLLVIKSEKLKQFKTFKLIKQ